jgi:triacylglycerol lipase
MRMVSPNKQQAIFLAECCLQTYNQFLDKGPFHVPDGYTLVKGFKAKAFGVREWFGFVLESDDSIIVAFRGTQTDPDWLADSEIFSNVALSCQVKFLFMQDFLLFMNPAVMICWRR